MADYKQDYREPGDTPDYPTQDDWAAYYAEMDAMPYEGPTDAEIESMARAQDPNPESIPF